MFPILIVLAGSLILYMVYEAWFGLEVTESTLAFDHLPEAFDGFRVVLISDFHSRGLGWRERRALATLRTVTGDLLVIAGDLKSRNTTPNEAIIPVLDAIVDVAHTQGYAYKPVYVRGNHDRRGFSHHCDERSDIESLRDRHIVIERGGSHIVVAGVRRTGRRPRRMRPAFRKAMRGVNPDDFVLFVSHTPDFFRMAARRGVDLLLAGDTHGGQIRIPFLGTFQSKSRLGRAFNLGHYQKWGAQIYVTRGIGYTGPPFRLACRPEIAVLTLKRKQN